jgi:hypothetical protein
MLVSLGKLATRHKQSELARLIAAAAQEARSLADAKPG